MYQRILQLTKTTDKKSAFLLGPRQVGKSTIVRQQLSRATVYNLQDSALYRRLKGLRQSSAIALHSFLNSETQPEAQPEVQFE